jgi:DNA end-binding protein Ku
MATRTRTKSSLPADPKPQAAEKKQEGKGYGVGLRSLWRGAISFGMVSIPVKLFAATSSKDLSFNLLHEKCSSRLQQKRWCPVCQKEVPWSEIDRGYEYAKDRYVRLTEEDFDKLPVPSKHVIDLDAFVKHEEIDPIYFEKSYYLEPEAAGRKAFALLLRALGEKGLTAVAKITFREKERLCALRVYDDSLILETLHYADEIRLHPGAETAHAEVSPRELDMALKLIDHLTERFDPKKYKDEYRDAVMEVVEAKLEGEQVVSAPRLVSDNVIDLMEALRASLQVVEGDATAGNGSGRNGKKTRREKAAA